MGEIVSVLRQRGSRLREGSELDSARRVRSSRQRREARAADRQRRSDAPEHAPRVGRRPLRIRAILRSLRSLRPPRVAGLPVLVQRLSAGRGRLPREPPRRGRGERAPDSASSQPGAAVRQQRDGTRLGKLGMGEARGRGRARGARAGHPRASVVGADAGRGDAGSRLGNSESGLRALLPSDAPRLADRVGAGRDVLAELAVVGRAVPRRQRPSAGGRALLGGLARPQAVHGVPFVPAAVHERVRLPGLPDAEDGRGVHRPRGSEPHLKGDGTSPARTARERLNRGADDRSLSGTEPVRRLDLSEPRPAGRGHPLRRRALATPRAPRRRDALLAARRLLAGGVVVVDRLLRALEGAALLRAAVLRPRAAFGAGRAAEDGRPPHERSGGGLERDRPLVPGDAGRRGARG